MKLGRPAVLAIALAYSVLAGCGSPPRVVSPSVPDQAAVDPGTLLVSLRAEAAALGETSTDVLPLRDAERAHWLAQVQARQAQGDLPGARALIDQALETSPGDPELLQEAAELALLAGDWVRAIELAGRSYEVGPRQGELCRRSWLTVAAARAALRDAERGETARERLALCSPPPPVRM